MTSFEIDGFWDIVAATDTELVDGSAQRAIEAWHVTPRPNPNDKWQTTLPPGHIAFLGDALTAEKNIGD